MYFYIWHLHWNKSTHLILFPYQFASKIGSSIFFGITIVIYTGSKKYSIFGFFFILDLSINQLHLASSSIKRLMRTVNMQFPLVKSTSLLKIYRVDRYFGQILQRRISVFGTKRKTTVEIADKSSRMIGAAWKNNILDCFEGVRLVKYWTFHGKRNQRDNLLKQYLGSLRPPPGAQYSYLGFCVDWVHLLRTGLGFESGVANVMSTIFDLWNNYKFVDRNSIKVIVRDALGNVLDRISRSLHKQPDLGIDSSAFFEFGRNLYCPRTRGQG